MLNLDAKFGGEKAFTVKTNVQYQLNNMIGLRDKGQRRKMHIILASNE